MAAANIEQQLLVLLCQGLIEHALTILTLNSKETGKVEKIENEALLIILGCYSGICP